MSSISDNRRIARNTFFLYLRMLVLLVVGLYTSRITLASLGISDYGIYNVVGGIVSMFVFINYAMINSTQRYITYELGRGDSEKLSLIFSTSVNIHAIISIIVIILSETVGLWFLYNKMTIPPERIDAALYVFQFSVISCFFSIMSVPYNALIIAHEKMSAFAYISLMDAFLKLIIVFLLVSYDGDRLILFGVLVLLVSIIDVLIYIQYCLRTFCESKYRFVVNNPLMIEMTKFASWNLMGNLSYVCYTQGLNLLLNVFFNPAVNAARGIAVQIQTVVSNFSYNIENAIKPQITKTYALQDMQRMHMLLFLSARISFFVLLLVSLPILLETNQILNLWLVEVPDHTINFIRLTILTLLSETLTNPLLTATQATGDIKKYQLSVSLLCFFILPVSYLALLIFPYPEIVFVVCLIFSFVIQFVKVWIVGRQINVSIRNYSYNVIIKCLAVLFLSFGFSYPIIKYMDCSIWRLIIVVFSCCAQAVIFMWLIGISHNEKLIIRDKFSYYIRCRYWK